ncbi:MAG TPA: hypothetical protein VJX92_00185 [Methylomirabilota bacterium]|nr:hypothetical protein [Methylomirabilota bacterium]
MGAIVARLASVVGVVGLSACGPMLQMEAAAPDGPRISDLRIVTPRTTAGCPITLRVHLESTVRSVDQALVGWVRLARRSQASQYVALAVRQERAEATLGPLTLKRSGAYAYQVQVSDRAGHWSNVLNGRIAVDAPAEETTQCS